MARNSLQQITLSTPNDVATPLLMALQGLCSETPALGREAVGTDFAGLSEAGSSGDEASNMAGDDRGAPLPPGMFEVPDPPVISLRGLAVDSGDETLAFDVFWEKGGDPSLWTSLTNHGSRRVGGTLSQTNDEPRLARSFTRTKPAFCYLGTTVVPWGEPGDGVGSFPIADLGEDDVDMLAPEPLKAIPNLVVNSTGRDVIGDNEGKAWITWKRNDNGHNQARYLARIAYPEGSEGDIAEIESSDEDDGNQFKTAFFAHLQSAASFIIGDHFATKRSAEIDPYEPCSEPPESQDHLTNMPISCSRSKFTERERYDSVIRSTTIQAHLCLNDEVAVFEHQGPSEPDMIWVNLFIGSTEPEPGLRRIVFCNDGPGDWWRMSMITEQEDDALVVAPSNHLPWVFGPVFHTGYVQPTDVTSS